MKKLTFLHYFKKYAFFYIISIVVLSLSIFLNMICPQITRRIVDEVLIGGEISALTPLLLCVLAVGIGRCVFQYAKEFLCDYAGSKIGCSIRLEIFRKIQSLSADFFDGINSGELMSRVKDDVDRIWDIFTYIAILIVEVVIHTAIALYFMFSLNWKLAIVPVFAMIGAACVAIAMEKKLGCVYETIAEENSIMNNTAAENLAGIRTVKAFVREPFEFSKFQQHNKRYYSLNIRQSKIYVRYNPILQCITYFLPCFIMLAGGISTINGKMTIGGLTAFLQYSTNIVWPMEMLGWLANGLSAAIASKQRLNKIFARESSITEKPVENGIISSKVAGSIPAIKGDIEFVNVCYKGTDGHEILKNVSFKIPAGSTVGIMGATGSGKTTIINLLKRLYDVSSGSIMIDGVDVRDISLSELRQNVSCVMQDVFLFSDTIENNVKLGKRKQLSCCVVENALEKSCSADFVSNMKEKSQTVIGERGIGLSGGQKQRLTIARALSRSSPVIVFDDSTSALDTETEREIQKKLESLSGMTKIIIAHRISAVRKADNILVLENGEVMEQGNHKQLLEKKGLYFQTYKSQY